MEECRRVFMAVHLLSRMWQKGWNVATAPFFLPGVDRTDDTQSTVLHVWWYTMYVDLPVGVVATVSPTVCTQRARHAKAALER